MSDAVLWLRMCDEDRARYAGPEWVAFDVGALMDTPASALERYERETGIGLFTLLMELDAFSARSTRASLWIALDRAGLGVPWAEFDPWVLRVQRRSEPPDAGNPSAGEDPPEPSPAG